MTTTAERQYPASWTLNQIRESQIIEILKDRHPESSDLIEAQSESARSRNGRRIIDHLAQWIERTEGNARGRANRSSPSVLHQLVTPT